MQQAPSGTVPAATVAPSPGAGPTLPSQWSTTAGDQFTIALNAALLALKAAANPAAAGVSPMATWTDPGLPPTFDASTTAAVDAQASAELAALTTAAPTSDAAQIGRAHV